MRVQDRAKPGGQPTVVMVVGAGRGPLVRASMRAAQEAGVPLRAYALEKNPCAVVHIQSMVAREGWQDQVWSDEGSCHAGLRYRASMRTCQSNGYTGCINP